MSFIVHRYDSALAKWDQIMEIDPCQTKFEAELAANDWKIYNPGTKTMVVQADVDEWDSGERWRG